MHKPALAIAVAVILSAASAVAQTPATGPKSNTVTPPAAKKTTDSAPVGHRQPRATDLPASTAASSGGPEPSAEDRELDRALKNICRNC